MDLKFINNQQHYLWLLIGLLCVTSSTPKQEKQEKSTPNVLLIQVDDLGFDDLSLHGNPHLETPNLDKLGRAAVQFDNFYLQSVCAPSRAALLTGRNFLKTGLASVHAGRDYVNLDETMISNVFQAAGYKTGMWGKWHSGKTDGYFPWDRGFDEAYYSCLYNYFDNIGLLNGKEVATKGYTTDALTDMAISFIKKNKDEPFFAYMSHLAPHNPWRTPQKYIDKYLAKDLSKPMSTLYGMIDNLDENIGRLIKTVEANGLSENTIIVFLSDNGPWVRSYRFGLTEEEWQMRNPSGYRGTKGTNWESGIKSPLFIKWGNRLTSTHIDRITKIEDLFPTLAAMCQIPLPDSLDLDGIDFSPIFEQKEVVNSKLYIANHSPKGNSGSDKADKDMSTPSEPLTAEFKATFAFENQGLALRDGNWKYIQNQKQGEKELYNLKIDPKETTNLFLEKSTIAADMEKDLNSWYQEVLAADSYTMPVFQIGYKGRSFSQIYALAPAHISENLRNNNHFIQNWAAVGDQANYDIKVHTEGTYQVSLVHEIKNYKDLSFSVSTAGSSTPETVLVNSGRNDFGTLLAGESAYWEDFDFKNTFRKSIVKSDLGTIELKSDDTSLQLILAAVEDKISTPENARVIAIHLEKVK